MSRFSYWRDALFVTAALAYAINRWLVMPFIPSPFLRGHFNDLLVIPAALPVVLWAQRLIGLREHDGAPSWAEMLMHLAVWSLICEFIGPRCFHHGTADAWDVVAYAVGGVAACGWWQRASKTRVVVP